MHLIMTGVYACTLCWLLYAATHAVDPRVDAGRRNPGLNPGVLAADSRSIQVPIPGGDAATPCFNARFPLVDTRVYTRVDTFLYFWSRWEDFLLDGFLDVLELMY